MDIDETPIKSERDKLMAGEPYRSRDPELLGMYYRAKALLSEFASTTPQESERKFEILSRLFGSVGSGVWIENPFVCDYGENIHIGNDCFINCNCVFNDNNTIRLGNEVLVGPAVLIFTASHPLNPDERSVRDAEGKSAYVTSAHPVTIGDRVWIGGGSIVLPGVTIGSGTTIGAGSVVSRDMPERCLAVGSPCRVIRNL